MDVDDNDVQSIGDVMPRRNVLSIRDFPDINPELTRDVLIGNMKELCKILSNDIGPHDWMAQHWSCSPSSIGDAQQLPDDRPKEKVKYLTEVAMKLVNRSLLQGGKSK